MTFLRWGTAPVGPPRAGTLWGQKGARRPCLPVGRDAASFPGVPRGGRRHPVRGIHVPTAEGWLFSGGRARENGRRRLTGRTSPVPGRHTGVPAGRYGPLESLPQIAQGREEQDQGQPPLDAARGHEALAARPQIAAHEPAQAQQQAQQGIGADAVQRGEQAQEAIAQHSGQRG